AIDEDIVMDHYGSTFAVDIAQVLDDKIIEEAVNAGAEEVQMYRTAFREEIADDITERADGEWVGYPEYDLAYFTERSDAKLCEELLEEFE
ncbi:MAG: hypothetical protein Q8930_17520, partial [Bacillota bacterium]|nr:hypothetical protein [Bacillota bacterium]